MYVTITIYYDRKQPIYDFQILKKYKIKEILEAWLQSSVSVLSFDFIRRKHAKTSQLSV